MQVHPTIWPLVGLVLTAGSLVNGQTPPAPSAQFPPSQVPRITLAPGLRDWPDYSQAVIEPQEPRVPPGFTALFNGKDLSGWHVSKGSSHGRTPDYRV